MEQHVRRITVIVPYSHIRCRNQCCIQSIAISRHSSSKNVLAGFGDVMRFRAVLLIHDRSILFDVA
jgi:hypothetical protein